MSWSSTLYPLQECSWDFSTGIIILPLPNHPLIKPSKLITSRPIPQSLGKNVNRPHPLAFLPIPSPIIHNHPPPQQKRQADPHASKSSSRRESRDVVWRILRAEDIAADDTHHVGGWDADGSEEQAAVFVGDVVVVPDVEDDAWGGGSPCLW